MTGFERMIKKETNFGGCTYVEGESRISRITGMKEDQATMDRQPKLLGHLSLRVYSVIQYYIKCQSYVMGKKLSSSENLLHYFGLLIRCK